jgi:hypothetical protein
MDLRNPSYSVQSACRAVHMRWDRTRNGDPIGTQSNYMMSECGLYLVMAVKQSG